MVTAAGKMPEDQRSYFIWKWWDWTFSIREDFPTLSRDIGLALLRRFEEGDAAERVVVGDLFDEADMTVTDLE
jgi:hypothetical protein